MYSYAFPGNIEQEILNIAARQIPYMRTPWFSELMKDNERRLLELISCSGGRVLFFTASGTGAMDAVVQNYVAALGKAFIIVGGSFGRRWQQLCDYHGIENAEIEVPFARDLDYGELERLIREHKPKVLLCQHHETSSGQKFNLELISEICHKYGVAVVVDVISTFLADELDMDALDLDVCITSSQKGLNLPPGASLVFLSKKALAVDFCRSNYYFDFQENLKNLERGQTPYSPATTIFIQMNERLKKIYELGAEGVEADSAASSVEIARRSAARAVEAVHDKALYFRSLCSKNGWQIPACTPSNAITGFYVNRNGDILFSQMLKKDIFIMPNSVKNFFRVSHMGVQTRADLDMLADAIKEIENR